MMKSQVSSSFHKRTALILGTSGQVGTECLKLLVEDNYYHKIIVLLRKDISIDHAKVEKHLVDFNNISVYKHIIQADDIYCSLGTSSKKKALFRKVDFEFPLEVAKLALESGAKKYFLVSALGANLNSSYLYLKTKGEIEAAISDLGYQSVHFFRISMMYGNKDHKRPLQVFSRYVSAAFSPFLWGDWKRYKSISAKTVAKSMIAAAQKEDKGVFIYESHEVQALGDDLAV